MGLFSFLKPSKNQKWHALKVGQKMAHSKDFIEISLEIPKDLESKFNFTPGQYVTVEDQIDGAPVRRSYSICAASKNPIKIGVKMVPNGLMSTHLHQSVQIGSSLNVHEPEGNFILNGVKSVAAFAAGSGITPIASMISAHQADIDFQVYYNIKTQEDILFKSLLDQVGCQYILTQEDSEAFTKGRINQELISGIVKQKMSILQSDVFLICGPENFMSEVRNSLLFFGVSESQIKMEYFTPPKDSTEKVQSTVDGICTLNVTMDHETRTLEMNIGKKTILEALEGAKLDPPYSCRGGVCSSCKAKITEGSATMRQNYNLTDKEIGQGYILTCQADPSSQNLSLTFDE